MLPFRLLTNRIDRINENGFLELTDAQESDMAIWQVINDRTKYLQVVRQAASEVQLDSGDASNEQQLIEKYSALNQKVFKHISEPFKVLLEQEVQARVDSKVWKRQMSNTRELCDICNTAIFNGHYGCTKCGLAVCLECMNNRLRIESERETMVEATPSPSATVYYHKTKLLLQRDSYDWPQCFRLNLKSLVFLISDKHPSTHTKADNSSFNIRILSQMVSHRPADLVFIQLIPPSSKHPLEVLIFWSD